VSQRHPPSRRAPSRPARQGRELNEQPLEQDVARFSDESVRCASCGFDAWDELTHCPRCDAPLRRRARDGLPRWAVAGVVAVLAAMLLGLVFALL
jgi:uncharacterized paraquat-inducible protein A